MTTTFDDCLIIAILVRYDHVPDDAYRSRIASAGPRSRVRQFANLARMNHARA